MIEIQRVDGNCSLFTARGNDNIKTFSLLQYSFQKEIISLIREEIPNANRLDVNLWIHDKHVMIFSNHYVKRIDFFASKYSRRYSKNLRRLGFKKIGSYKKGKVSILIAPLYTSFL